MNTTQTPATVNDKQVKPNFGQGRYSAEMERIYDASMVLFGIEEKKAERIARMAGSDAGAAFKNATATIKVSKVKGKDSTVTIKDASEMKGVRLTNPLAVVRAIEWIGDAGKNFVSYGHTKWRLTPELVKWIEDMEVVEKSEVAAE